MKKLIFIALFLLSIGTYAAEYNFNSYDLGNRLENKSINDPIIIDVNYSFTFTLPGNDEPCNGRITGIIAIDFNETEGLTIGYSLMLSVWGGPCGGIQQAPIQIRAESIIDGGGNISHTIFHLERNPELNEALNDPEFVESWNEYLGSFIN